MPKIHEMRTSVHHYWIYVQLLPASIYRFTLILLLHTTCFAFENGTNYFSLGCLNKLLENFIQGFAMPSFNFFCNFCKGLHKYTPKAIQRHYKRYNGGRQVRLQIPTGTSHFKFCAAAWTTSQFHFNLYLFAFPFL